jgi:hypothetical protein
MMITDTEIKIQGIETLIKALGEVNAAEATEAERFITLLLREPFDYTTWQRTLWPDKSIKAISRMAIQNRALSEQERAKR